jgi:hypothetical protein
MTFRNMHDYIIIIKQGQYSINLILSSHLLINHSITKIHLTQYLLLSQGVTYVLEEFVFVGTIGMNSLLYGWTV